MIDRTQLTEAPAFPLMSEDGDWYAFPGDWTKRQCVSEMVHNLTDWYLDDHTTIDDEDKVHGWFAAYRHLFDAATPSFLRPYNPYRDTEGEAGWWFETTDPTGVPAMVVKP